MILTESNLDFIFDEDIWAWATDYDPKGNQTASPCYAFKRARQGASDIDFVAISHKGTVLLIEVKGYFLPSNKSENARNAILKNIVEHLSNDTKPLPEKIATNIGDATLAIIGAARTHTTNTVEWQKIAKAIGDSENRLIVLVWIEEDFPHLTESGKAVQEAKSRASVYKQILEKKLAWLTPDSDIFVQNILLYENELGLAVNRL
jgi:hypothetical protein